MFQTSSFKIAFCQVNMWSYRYIWATSLAFFCVEVGLWMFCKLGDPAIPKILTGIRRNRCAGDEIHKTKTQISKKIFQTRGTLLHSGNKENQYSITEVFEILKKQGGFFLDIGTRAGRFLSDSLWLEKQHDWTGLLMELNPHKCKQITKLKGKARRLCGCMSNSQSKVSFQAVDGVNQVTEHTLESDNKTIIPCIDVSQVLRASGVNRIDFCSLNVESAGSAILDLMRSLVTNETFKIDVWSLIYRVRNSDEAVVERSTKELNA